MKTLLSILLMLCCVIGTFAQKKKNQVVVGDAGTLYYDQGKSEYDKERYTEAIPYFVEALKADSKNEDALYYLGWSYKQTGQTEKALEQFALLEKLNPNYSPRLYYELGGLYAEAGQFEKAAFMQEAFLKRSPATADKTLERHQAQYKLHYSKEQKDLRSNVIAGMKQPVKLAAPINSEWGDFMPILNPTGTKLYFTSKRKGGLKFDDATVAEGDDDLYFIEKIDGHWSAPKLLPEPINSAKNEGAACFSADGQTMIYVGCSREDGVGSCDLYIAYLEGSNWTVPVNMGNVVNCADWDSQPTISPDGSKIIFCSGRAGSYGTEDLYLVEKNQFG